MTCLNKMTSVAVTMFFDLKSLSDATDSVRPVEFYVKNGQNTLSLDCPMVILCDAITRSWIEELRTRAGHAEKTIYIEKSLSDYEHYFLNHDIITTNRKSHSAYSTSRVTPSYCLTTMLKFHAIKIAEKVFPDMTHYFWIDFGCAHIARDTAIFLPKMLEKPNPRVSCLYIHYRSATVIEKMESYLASVNPCSLAATIFSVEKSWVNLFYTRGLSIFYEMLSRGVGHNEEAVLVYLYTRFPEMFHLYYGDYFSTASNYHFVHSDYLVIKSYFLETTLRDGRRDLARTCALKILESITYGALSLPETEIEYLRSI